MIKDIFDTTTTTIGKVLDWFRSARSDNLAQYTRITQSQPIALVEDRLMQVKGIDDVMMAAVNTYAAYLLQACAIAFSPIGDIQTIRTLEKLNPKRDPIAAGVGTASSVLLSEESYKTRLPDVEYLRRRMTMEAFDSRKLGDEDASFSIGRDTRKTATEASNLAVGLVLEINLQNGVNKATLPITVRLAPTMVSSQSLVHILAYAAKGLDVSEQWYDWRAGSIDLISDVICCKKIVNEYRAARIKDTSGFFEEVIKRRDHNRLAGIFSGQPSVATASNILVLSTESVAALEREIGTPLKDFKTRQHIFANIYCMMIMVVDTEFQMVTIYHDGISLPSHVTMNQLKVSSSGKGPDVAEILRAYQLGNAPTF